VFCVTGATGFVGRHLVRSLAQLDLGPVSCLVREPSAGETSGAENVTFLKGDMRDPVALNKLAMAGNIMVNLAFSHDLSAAENLAAARKLINACANTNIRRLIHISTAAVIGRTPANWVDENTPCQPVSDYEHVKLEIEKILLTAHDKVDVVIVRPTAIFGAGGRNLVKLAAEISVNEKFHGYLRACFHGKRAMNLVSVENVVAAISHLALLPENPSGRIFNVADDDAIANNYEAVEARLLHAFNRPPRSLPVLRLPPPLQQIGLRLAGRPNIYPQRRYSCSKLLSSGFKRPVDFETALDRYAAYLVEQFMRYGKVRG